MISVTMKQKYGIKILARTPFMMEFILGIKYHVDASVKDKNITKN